ncbi:hypothetical protein Tco_0647891 [Tanacetum coccineum]
MSTNVARGHDDDGDGDDRPPPHQIGGGCRGKNTQKPNLGCIPARKPGTLDPIIGLRTPRTGLTTWKLSDPDFPQTSLRQIGMSRSGFGLILRTWPGVLKMLETGQRTRSYAGRDPGHLLPSKTGSSQTREYPSLIQTYFDTHNVDGVLLRDEERRLYELQRLQALREYTDDQIMVIVRKDKQCRHIFGVGRVLAGRGKDVLDVPEPRCNHTSDVDELKKNNKQLKKRMDMIIHNMTSGVAAGVARGVGDDELGDDEDAGEDQDDEDS